jgi:hypothetical protein
MPVLAIGAEHATGDAPLATCAGMPMICPA